MNFYFHFSKCWLPSISPHSSSLIWFTDGQAGPRSSLIFALHNHCSWWSMWTFSAARYFHSLPITTFVLFGKENTAVRNQILVSHLSYFLSSEVQSWFNIIYSKDILMSGCLFLCLCAFRSYIELQWLTCKVKSWPHSFFPAFKTYIITSKTYRLLFLNVLTVVYSLHVFVLKITFITEGNSKSYNFTDKSFNSKLLI